MCGHSKRCVKREINCSLKEGSRRHFRAYLNEPVKSQLGPPGAAFTQGLQIADSKKSVRHTHSYRKSTLRCFLENMFSFKFAFNKEGLLVILQITFLIII